MNENTKNAIKAVSLILAVFVACCLAIAFMEATARWGDHYGTEIRYSIDYNDPAFTKYNECDLFYVDAEACKRKGPVE